MKKISKLLSLELLGFAASVLPLLITVIVRWDRYIKVPAGKFRLTFGLMVVLLFMLLKALGKLKMPRRVFVFAMISGLAWVLQSVLYDLSLLSGMAFIGEMVDMIFFQPQIKKLRDKSKNEELASAISEAIGGNKE